MHSVIINLADRIGVKFSDRCASDSYVYDGETIATNYVHVHTKERRWFLDHDLLHEVMHYHVASKFQREKPEYGLTVGIAPHTGAFGPRNKYGDYDINLQTSDQIVPYKEQEIQEWIAIFLCIHYGRKLGISPALDDYRNSSFIETWDAYEKYKEYELKHMTYNLCEGYLKELVSVFII